MDFQDYHDSFLMIRLKETELQKVDNQLINLRSADIIVAGNKVENALVVTIKEYHSLNDTGQFFVNRQKQGGNGKMTIQFTQNVWDDFNFWLDNEVN